MAQQPDPYAATAIRPLNAPAAVQPLGDPYAATAVGAAPPADPAPPTFGQYMSNVGQGMLKGAVNTMAGADNWATKHLPTFMTTPIGQAATPENSARATQYAKVYAAPDNSMQSLGKGIEQAGEFMLPGSSEEAAYNVLKAFPEAAKILPLAKAGFAGIGSGVMNKMQGGSFAGGAAAGAGGSLVGAGIQKLAPAVAETALKARAIDRAYGRTPGQAILDETTGINPGTIADQANAKLGLYSNQLDMAAKASSQPVNLLPARTTANSFLETAGKRNNAATIKDVATIGKQLDARGTTAIPQFVSADEALALKRGVGDLKTSWNPATASDFSNTAVDQTLHAMHPELQSAIPGYQDLNSKISSLMPVAKRAAAADLNAGIVQRTVARMGAHTGALLGGITGGGEGYRQGGWQGAAIGGGAGLLLPEIAMSPELQMAAARGLYSPAVKPLIKMGVGAGLQVGRKSLYDPQ